MFSGGLVILAFWVLPIFSAPSPLVKVQMAKEAVAGRYIVTLKDGVSREAAVNTFSRKAGGISPVTHQWEIINGFAGTFSATELEVLRSNPDVISIEEDGLVHTQTVVNQTDAPWGLGRISSKTKLVNQNAVALAFSYEYDSTAGSGATVFVIDTGVFTNHSAFGGRARWGATFIPNPPRLVVIGGYPSQDGHGHGTHCAGTAISGPYGVAKNAMVVAVKVLDDLGDGTLADIISGINWVAGNRGSGPAVASLSLGGSVSSSIDNAVTNLIKSGVTTAIAAGNDNVDAIGVSPARVGAAITVGATTITDTKAFYSNFGSIIDIWAPGSNVISTWNNGGTNTLSGTSMAAPHVAGYAAYLLGLDSSLTPSSVESTIMFNALTNVLSGIPEGTANRLLNLNNPI